MHGNPVFGYATSAFSAVLQNLIEYGTWIAADAMKEYFPHGRIQISGSVFQIISFPVPTHQFQPIAPGQKLLPAHLCHWQQLLFCRLPGCRERVFP